MFYLAQARGKDRLDRSGTCIAEQWHSIFCASRDELVFLAYPQLVLPTPCPLPALSKGAGSELPAEALIQASM